MKKYEVDKEFKILEKMKIPGNPKVLPMANVFLHAVKGRSDKKVTVKCVRVKGYEGEEIPVYIMEPKNVNETLPCILDIHGGGFILAASPGHFGRAKEYAQKMNCRVIFPDYRLAPKRKCPTALEDCYAVYEWMLENEKELKIDTERMAIMGDSAGGNLAIGVTLLAKDRGLKLPKQQILIYPATDRRLETESMQKYIDTPVWDAKLSKLMWELYLDNSKPEYIEYVSPMENKDLAGLPPTYVEVAEFDAIRDEGIAFAEQLEQTGVEIELHEVKGTPHGYDNVRNSSEVKKLMERRLEILRKIFE